MPTFQPLWETDPVQYLAFCKFPELAMFWKPLDGERRLTAKDRASMIQEADAYKESLWNLSDAEISAMVEKAIPEEKARYLERQEQEEKQRPFHQPYARADVSHWASASYWTLDEGVALSLGKEPRIAQWTVIQPIIHASAFARTFNNRRDLVQRAKVMGQLWDQTSPSIFLAWAERMRFSMPADLVEAVESLGIQICDWKTLHDRDAAVTKRLTDELVQERDALVNLQATMGDLYGKAVEHQRLLADAYEAADNQIAMIEAKDHSIAELSARISLLESSSSSKSADAMGARERDSLLKLVIGMAVKGYSHDPKASRSPTSKEIAGDLALIGLAMDEDTVRKYLTEARQLLPGDQTE